MDSRDTLGEGSQHDRAMGHGFVAGNPYFTVSVPPGCARNFTMGSPLTDSMTLSLQLLTRGLREGLE